MKENATETLSTGNLPQFKEKVKSMLYCADLKNRLFQIDRNMVLWDTAGSCLDASFAVTLFGNTVEETLCSHRDSVYGLKTSCIEERHQELFQTIIENLDKPDLGLGTGHQVEPVAF
jgi:hypothetical protein